MSDLNFGPWITFDYQSAISQNIVQPGTPFERRLRPYDGSGTPIATGPLEVETGLFWPPADTSTLYDVRFPLAPLGFPKYSYDAYNAVFTWLNNGPVIKAPGGGIAIVNEELSVVPNQTNNEATIVTTYPLENQPEGGIVATVDTVGSSGEITAVTVTTTPVITVDETTFDNLINIGSTSLGALGNSKPPTYIAEDPTNVWTDAGTPATTGYPVTGDTGYGQSASWLPYDTTNTNDAVTQWGFLRLLALQAWNEANFNSGDPTKPNTNVTDFLNSFTDVSSSIDYVNEIIIAASKANTFLDGVYSNMNDLISADATGVNLASVQFGNDLINLGKVINLNKIDAFGLPSVLLEILGKNGAITQDLSLSLIASGLTNKEITNLINGSTVATKDQEAKIYGAFLLIAGENLNAILTTLQCSTIGIENLTDLLNLKKLFPNSYSSMTVPMYNGKLGLPTNSKTYYTIYNDGNINPALTTTEMQEYVGVQAPNNVPTESNSSLTPENYSLPPIGFGSYLYNIIPTDQAIAAGAFSFTMRQIPGIENTDIKEFANVIKSMETVTDLNLLNGTSKPTNQDAIDKCIEMFGLGSGPYGSYTLSDFYGSMSGLPYPLEQIETTIKEVESTKLKNIYNQLFLAVTWEQAELKLSYTTRVDGLTTYYTVTGITITNTGGGYGRGSAPVPTVTINGGSGATAIVTIGTDDTDAGSNKQGTFGRITSVLLTAPGIETSTLPTVTIQAPPIGAYAVQPNGNIATGAVNVSYGTTAWPNPLNNVIQQYIDQANEEIVNIENNNVEKANKLKTYWNIVGEQLKIEQRTRYRLLKPVTIPKSDWDTSSPIALMSFVDFIPSYALATEPHMYAQTLEAIGNLNTLGGQSMVGLLREARNQYRLGTIGVELDNGIPSVLSGMERATLIANGTIKAGVNNAIDGYTNPSWFTNNINGIDIAPVAKGVYVPTNSALVGTYIPNVGIIPRDLPPVVDPGTVVPVTPSPNDPIVKPPDDLDPNIPPNLNTDYTSSTLLPNSLNVNEAIDKVIECNCTCWIN